MDSLSWHWSELVIVFLCAVFVKFFDSTKSAVFLYGCQCNNCSLHYCRGFIISAWLIWIFVVECCSRDSGENSSANVTSPPDQSISIEITKSASDFSVSNSASTVHQTHIIDFPPEKPRSFDRNLCILTFATVVVQAMCFLVVHGTFSSVGYIGWSRSSCG
jgi:hypothetical protein